MNDMIASAINKMALIDSYEAKQALEKDAKSYSLSGWQTVQKVKLGGVGALTGVVGGPVGIALEGLDIAYLLAMSGRACYGIGHIKDREIDYDSDIAMILAIWCGAAEAGGSIAVGKVGIKVAGKGVIVVGAKAVGMLAGKLAAKSALKLGSKAGAKIISYASAKLAAKIVGKLSVKWIPIIGGVVGAGINIWIMSGLMDAANSYYSNDYVILGNDLAAEVD